MSSAAAPAAVKPTWKIFLVFLVPMLLQSGYYRLVWRKQRIQRRV